MLRQKLEGEAEKAAAAMQADHLKNLTEASREAERTAAEALAAAVMHSSNVAKEEAAAKALAQAQRLA